MEPQIFAEQTTKEFKDWMLNVWTKLDSMDVEDLLIIKKNGQIRKFLRTK